MRIESLEIRTLLSGTPADLASRPMSSPTAVEPVQVKSIPENVVDDFNLTIAIDGDFVTLPENLGVATDGSFASLYTLSDDGQILFHPADNPTLGDFFQVWQNDAGIAGNNPDALLSSTQLMGYSTDYDHTLQMFVNGQLTTEYDQYLVQDGDAIVLVYGSDTFLSLNTTYGSIVVELFQDQTPGTVDNFLNYVNDGDYIDSIFHRSVNDFVIQGGGYTTTSTTFTGTDQFTAIPTDDPITNEPGISNTRGTLAMAKLGGDPDSATSQFFINLSDENTFLDLEAYNRFTVFGRILGMDTVDEIAALPIDSSHGSPFGELPLGPNNRLAVIESIAGYGDLTGIKYIDANGNSQYDDGELGIPDVAIYADINDNGVRDAGEAHAITDGDGRYRLQMEPGAYILRAEVSQESGVPTVAGLAVTVEIGRELAGLDFGELDLPAPVLERLQSESDTGIADDDNITAYNNTSSDTTLNFLVSNAVEGAEVRVYSDALLIGSTTATSDQVVVATDGLTPLADGIHEITVTQSWAGFESGPSTELLITVDSTAPAEITSPAPEDATLGALFVHDVESPDEGNEGIYYSLAGAPAGMDMDPDTGIIQWNAVETGGDPLSFQILLSDTAGNAVTQSVEMLVLGEIPAYPDQYTVAVDSILDVAEAEGVLNNDGNSETPILTATLVENPGHGELVFASDGSFTYTPSGDFLGDDSFTYMAFDGDSYSNVAKVTIHVYDSGNNRLSGYVYLDANLNGIRDNKEVGIPGVLITLTGLDNTGSAIERSLLTANSGMYEFVDIPAGAYQLVESQPAAFHDGSDTTTVPEATVGDDQISDIGLRGGVVWTENNFGESALLPEYHSIVWFFASTVDPQRTLRDMVAIAEENAGNTDLADQIRSNTPPVAVADTYETVANSTLTVAAAQGVLANDSDIDSAILEAVLLDYPTHGTVLLDADGSFEYVPESDYVGSDGFTYRVRDGEDLSNVGTVSIAVIADQTTTSEKENTGDTLPGQNDLLDVLSKYTVATDLVMKEVQHWLPALL